MRHAERSSLWLLAFSAAAACAHAEDWPNFRGPRYDGISRETGLKSRTDQPLKLIWERDVGPAFSSFAIVGDRLFTCGTIDKKQTLLCLNAKTGEPIWQTPFEEQYVERQGGDGTRATPTVDGQRVYVLGALGTVACFNAADGTDVWKQRFGDVPTWGYSGSVLIEGDRAIVAVGSKSGGLRAFDKASGKELWTVGDDAASYASPYPFTMDGQRYVVGFLAKSVVIVTPEGQEVCRIPWKTDWDVNAAGPIFHDGHLFISSGYDTGSALFKLKRDGDKLTAEQLWKSKVLLSKFQTAILHQGHLYCSDQRSLYCVDFLKGEKRWRELRVGEYKAKDGTLVMAEGNLYFLTEKGELVIAPADPEKFTELARARILDGLCWSVPVIHDGKLYARDLKRLVCFDLKK